MTTIDWNAPDFCKKYQYRDGRRILAVHTLPHPFHALTDYRHATTDGSRIYRHLDSGRICNSHSENGSDIVSIPREPRTIEGWVKPEIFGDAFLRSHCVLTYQPRRPEEWVKAKITEVIE